MFPYYGLDKYFEDIEPIFKHAFPIQVYIPLLKSIRTWSKIENDLFVNYICKYDRLDLFKALSSVYVPLNNVAMTKAFTFSSIKILRFGLKNGFRITEPIFKRLCEKRNDPVLDVLCDMGYKYTLDTSYLFESIKKFGDMYETYACKLLHIIPHCKSMSVFMELCLNDLLESQQYRMYNVLQKYYFKQVLFDRFYISINILLQQKYKDESKMCLSKFSVTKEDYCALFDRAYFLLKANPDRDAWMKCAIELGDLSFEEYQKCHRLYPQKKNKFSEFSRIYSLLNSSRS